METYTVEVVEPDPLIRVALVFTRSEWKDIAAMYGCSPAQLQSYAHDNGRSLDAEHYRRFVDKDVSQTIYRAFYDASEKTTS